MKDGAHLAFDTLAPEPWIVFSGPLPWPSFGRDVLADRHLADGTRQHIVSGTIEPGQVFANAQLFGEDHLKTLTPKSRLK